jgi:hypothetical protein
MEAIDPKRTLTELFLDLPDCPDTDNETVR